MAKKGKATEFGPELVVAIVIMVLTALGLVPLWVPFLEERPGLLGSLGGALGLVLRWWWVPFWLGLVCLAGYLLLVFRRRVAVALKRVRWWVLWHVEERDLRSRIGGLGQIGAEVLAATLRLGRKRQDRRLFLSLADAEALVRRRRYPPQAGIGGAAWATKGCEELRQAGLVEQYGDARNQTWIVWLDKRVGSSRLGARLVDGVEGIRVSRGKWRW
jgi:hypothetical protein